MDLHVSLRVNTIPVDFGMKSFSLNTFLNVLLHDHKIKINLKRFCRKRQFVVRLSFILQGVLLGMAFCQNDLILVRCIDICGAGHRRLDSTPGPNLQ